MPDVVVIGAGIVGAACAHYAAEKGLTVTVVDRGPVASGTTGAGEGNILVSDKEPGPELDLALLSSGLWRELAAPAGPYALAMEYEQKGGLVVAGRQETMAALAGLAARQAASGVERELAADPRELEPDLAPGLAGGVLYPQDAQVQPMRAAAALLACGGSRRAVHLLTGTEVTGLLRDGDRVAGVRTGRGDIHADAVVNAAGTWGGEIAAMAGTALPVHPRRGFILVTEPLTSPRIRHKVYTAAYITDVAGDSAGLASSAVVESTMAGTVLIGASRERVGFDRTPSTPVLRTLAAQAVALFPGLADRHVIRTYCGFRPYLPDHLPAIGQDPSAPGLLHACGHEGAGVGLAPATGHLIARLLAGERPDLDLGPFDPGRFA
ncbi:Glycine/D-amino acid oxidase [Sinosporangium album]|uniref:Glycine/D-amino acid oxidase n=1 Tax=Sinosporangium album TaxID=504805 RepID=A0A1G7WJ83_9ACTN|nr:FAD-binding oxidoreductase [Sinosporangium album]SDG71928.1 Glycine/D-amino acid oxidase [Sinosporangium album]